MILKRTIYCFFNKAVCTFPTHTKSKSVFKYFLSDNVAFGVKKVAGFYNDISNEYWIQVFPLVFIKKS